MIDSQTTTLTLWSTEVQTSTEHIKGASTVTVWLVTPAPEIKSKTWAQEETFTFIRTGTATSYWTETKPVETSMVTVTGPETTWTDGGKPAPTPCRECDTGQNSNPPRLPASSTSSTSSGPPSPAWTQTTARGANPWSVAPAGGNSLPPVSASSLATVGWAGNPQAPGAAPSPASSSLIPGPGQPMGSPIATGPGAMPASVANTQGQPIQPGTGVAAQGVADSPFTSDAASSLRSLGLSTLLLVGTVVCAVTVL